MASQIYEGSSCSNTYVTSAHVLGFEEKTSYFHSEYYFIIEVTWNYGRTDRIRRRYLDFFYMQCAILDRFPEQNNPVTRTLPYLPGRKMFTFNTRKVAESRVKQLNAYLEQLIHQDHSISQSNMVLNFFEFLSSDDDISTSEFSQQMSINNCTDRQFGSKSDLLNDP
ncbi:SH3 and PX domain-containing protein 2B-like isoform X1 [Tubulanus polymorphus]|uniref:SH3 and PX domain-containing protein 2B-like isoform X1 n=1 Tax=Tubulanus polymorphus TaxID=672921 RepID=UPI003DA60D3C